MLVNKATLGAVLALLYVTPVSAQWEMEESAETDPLRSRPAAMAASLYDTEHRLVWEYACFRALSGSYMDSLDLYIEGNDGEQFTQRHRPLPLRRRSAGARPVEQRSLVAHVPPGGREAQVPRAARPLPIPRA